MNSGLESNPTIENPVPAVSEIAATRQGMTVHVAMLGARQHYAVPRLLHRSDLLGKFYTDIYIKERSLVKRILQSLPLRCIPKNAQRLLGRSEQDLPSNSVISFPAFGISYWWKRRHAPDFRKLHRVYAESAQLFNNEIIRRGVPNGDVLYGYNGAALELFQFCKKRGISIVLEQTILPFYLMQKLIREEIQRWPDWQPGLSVLEENNDLSIREQEEWKLADLILGGSQFVMDGLREMGVPESKCRSVPYGVPLNRYESGKRHIGHYKSKLRILFAGEVGIRKGTQYLLEALNSLNSSLIEARFAGSVALNSEKLKPFQSLVDILGPVPRIKMAELFQWADILVAPSICEGSALVTFEALASGVPVIATPNVGSPVRNEIDGLIVPIRDVDALSIAIERFLKDREFLNSCSRNAIEGRDRLGLEAYQKRLVGTIHKMKTNSKNEKF
jgi:glycosyltransferase involved in cell wall biosynthesis